MFLQERSDDGFVESRGERASGQRCIDNVGDGRCKYRQTFLSMVVGIGWRSHCLLGLELMRRTISSIVAG